MMVRHISLYLLLLVHSNKLQLQPSTEKLCRAPDLMKRAMLQMWDDWYSDWLRAGRPRGWSSSPGRDKNFVFSTSSKPALEPTQPPVQSVPVGSFLGVKAAGAEADHSPPTSAEVKKM
jgi:hypothetical protein